jgi:peroxiredoxin Q/BCP
MHASGPVGIPGGAFSPSDTITMKTLLIISLLALIAFLAYTRVSAKHLVVGDTVPHFALYDQNGQLFDSKDYIGKKICVIYFYPRDESSVCTKEACSFRDSYAAFEKAGAIVVGINAAAPEVHRKFAEHHQLPFRLLSDPGNKVLKLFGVKGMVVITGRETFVVGLDGKVAFTYNSMSDGERHVAEALKFLHSQHQ